MNRREFVKKVSYGLALLPFVSTKALSCFINEEDKEPYGSACMKCGSFNINLTNANYVDIPKGSFKCNDCGCIMELKFTTEDLNDINSIINSDQTINQSEDHYTEYLDYAFSTMESHFG